MKKNLVTLTVLGLLATMAIAEPAPKQRPLMKDFMGINTFCDQFRPELYRETCELVRNYHNYPWDVEDSTQLPIFPLARREFNGQAFDWGALYESWKQNGWRTDVSIKLQFMPAENWKDVEKDAYAYGKAFAEFFGPSGKHNLVESVEVGNEPAHYDTEFYGRLFEAMARGFRDGDPKIKVLPAAVQAGAPDKWAKPIDVLKGKDALYDALNVHKYPLINGWPYWARSYPEDPNIDYLETFYEVIRWRNQNAPDKEIWITEFGYDACSKPNVEEKGFTKWMDVTDEQQAQWIIRSFLIFSAIDIDRAYLYWFNDRDTPSFHAASGITRHYQPKPSFWAMKHLYDTLGNYRFNQIICWEVGDLYIQEYVHGDHPEEIIWAVWRATGDRAKVDRLLELPAEPYKAHRMAMEKEPANVPCIKDEKTGKYNFEVNGSPIYLWMKKSQ